MTSLGDGDRLDRNWQELLQELRVAQTGIQVLTGFLLTIPFTERFHDLPESRRVVYGVIFTGAVVAMLLLMSPVALHRALFHQGARPWLVDAADLFARWGLGVMALTILGVVWFILDVVAATWIGSVVTGVLATFVVAVWVVLPAYERRRSR
ncbi:MAG: DUF6328 family protein [Aeromicrobium sp.]